MSNHPPFHQGQRLSYDGALCTVRCILSPGQIPHTKGPWLGVEWDDPQRGKHDGTLHGHRYFHCKSTQPTVASFVRPARTPNPERTLLQAIRGKYQAGQDADAEAVVISGKVAQEIGFGRVAREQSVLANLRVVLVDRACVVGVVAGRDVGDGGDAVEVARRELAEACPTVRELDLSCNPIERWEDVEDVCRALPQLRVLKLNSIRFMSLASRYSGSVFANLHELHLNECLLTASDVVQMLGSSDHPRLPNVSTLWLSQNELTTFRVPDESLKQHYDHVKTLMLEVNAFTSLDELIHILEIFPGLKHISLQSNKVEHFGDGFFKAGHDHPMQYPIVESLNLAMNDIKSFDFIDKLPLVFPNLLSLRLSNNPVYNSNSVTSTNLPTSSIDTNFFLTLARIPTLVTLNYTTITARERDEGEIYYLSITEKEITTYLDAADLSTDSSRQSHLTILQHKFPRYRSLCEKHGRDSLFIRLTSPADPTLTAQPSHRSISHPTGSLASRLVNATIYISSPPPPSPIPALNHPLQPSLSFTKPLPTTLPASSLYSRVSQTLRILPLQFTLIYESPELDPVRDDLTTRSQLYSSDSSPLSSSTKTPKPKPKTATEKWRDWGDWDVDYLVSDNEFHPSTSASSSSVDSSVTHNADTNAEEGNENEGNEIKGKWNEEGHLVRDGKKWRRRETEIPFGMKSWGEFLDLDPRDGFVLAGTGAGGRIEEPERVGSGTRDVVLRVELRGWYLKAVH